MLSPTGRVGALVPSGIATDNTTKEFFSDLVNTKTLASLYDFENRKKLFPAVDSRMKFCLLTMTGSDRPAEAADFSFFALDVADLKNPERRFPLSTDDIRLLNPNTRTCPIFRTRRDSEVTRAIHRRIPVLINETRGFQGNPWDTSMGRMFHISDDSELFSTPSSTTLKLYEAKSYWQFDHRHATYEKGDYRNVTLKEKWSPNFQIHCQYEVEKAEIPSKFKKKIRTWYLAYRNITNATNERTLVTCILPHCGLLNSGNIFYLDNAPHSALLLACLNSIPVDYICRQKLGGANMSYGVLAQLPTLPPDAYDDSTPWSEGTVMRDWLTPLVLELTYTAWDLEPFARDLGYDGPPFRWDPERRFLLRCELDAAFFHLYGIGRDDADYIMETFPIVKRKDEAAHGEYRTKRVILEIYDQMARAASGATGQPYQTPLDPPPASLDLDLAPTQPATVTPLRPRTAPEPESAQPQEIAAENRGGYAKHPRQEAEDPGQTQPEPSPRHRGNLQPTLEGDQQPNLLDQTAANRPAPVVPNLYEAGLALHACLPDGEKVQKDALLQDAARELGHEKLPKKVRSALNKALNAEHNAGRLKTDWKLVWKPRKR